MTRQRRESAKSIRILARPYKNTAEPGQGRVYDEMVNAGHVVEEFTLARLVRERWDIVHVHYPEAALRRPGLAVSLVGVLVLLVILVLGRLKGAVIVGTGHNAQSHEQHHPLLERVVVAVFDRAVGAMTFPSETARRIVADRRPRLRGLPSRVVPLTNYRWERSEVSNVEARAELGLPADALVLLFLGLIRSYKNVPALIDAFTATTRKDVLLVVAGNPASEELAAEVKAAAAGDERVRVDLRYIEPSEVSSLMAASDLVVLPFSAVLNSASTLLALSHDRPVMVPAAGSLVELANRAGEEWFFFFDGPISSDEIADVLRERDARLSTLATCSPNLEWCDVRSVARQTEDFYSDLVA